MITPQQIQLSARYWGGEGCYKLLGAGYTERTEVCRYHGLFCVDAAPVGGWNSLTQMSAEELSDLRTCIDVARISRCVGASHRRDVILRFDVLNGVGLGRGWAEVKPPPGKFLTSVIIMVYCI